MKGVRSILAIGSVVTFLASFSAFVICSLAGRYNNLVWLGITAFISFSVMIVTLGSPNDEDKGIINYRFGL